MAAVNKQWKILQVMGIPDHLTCLLRNLYAGQKQQLELDMEQWTGSKLGKSMSRLYIVTLLFNMLSRLVIISWLQSPSAVILEPRKMKSATVSTVSPSHEVMEPDTMILVF